MVTNNYLITVTDHNLVNFLAKVQNCTFLFPLQDFCVGYERTFTLNEIEISNAYLLINRFLTDRDLRKLKAILSKNTLNIKGIIFRDLGVLELIKELKLDVQKIYYLAHNGLNYQSINEYLLDLDSVIISTDLTAQEITEIIPKLNKKVILYAFGLIEIMYSRRTLLTNFNKQFNEPLNKASHVIEPLTNKAFKVIENAYGTVFFSDKYYFAQELLNLVNLKYLWLNPIGLSVKQIKSLIDKLNNHDYDLSDLAIETSPIFLQQKSTYKLRSEDNV